ncbi:MAG: hybrid sensor histidine kinase/response regulator, partial [Deltaproteobacteria bacterium]|nr:hybrid sensor histidine kinase/response regulator [Deltaproteobacteria bacterium]
ELRTPLNGILGYSYILKHYPEQLNDGLRVIEQSGQHLLTLINDLLDLARVEAGKIELQPTNFNLPELIENVLHIIQIRADNKALEFRREIDEQLPLIVHGDVSRLHQVLLNLLDNAVKFTEQGHVTFKIRLNAAEKTHPSFLRQPLRQPLRQTQEGPQEEPQEEPRDRHFILLSFEIADTGPGIPAEYLAQIFHPFERI